MKTLAKILLILYLLTLLWLVLFKFSYDVFGVLADHQARSLSLVPFSEYSPSNMREMVTNLVVFIPFGLLLGINLGRAGFGRKLAFVFAFSIIAEIFQFAFAIGRTDITDVIMNSLGGFIGLVMYEAAKKIIEKKYLDGFIVVLGALLLVSLMLLRVLVFRVRY